MPDVRQIFTKGRWTVADQSDRELERLDPESEACYVGLRDLIAEELGARVAVGDDPTTHEGQAGLAELVADAILDGFTIRERNSPRYRWRNAETNTIEVAQSTETENRKREVQILLNIADPNPEYQPFILTDEASLLDAVATEPGEISRRLTVYFGNDLDLDLRMPVWRLIDQIKQHRPDWPNEA